MALSRGRGGNRFSATIWPGFVDAMTALLMVLMFVITIFMVVQSALRDTVDRQESQLGQLSDQVAGLSSTLSVTQDERARAQAGLTEAQQQLLDFEAQVARLAAARDTQDQRASTAEAALASARDEIDAQTEQARLAAARREALQALVADLEAKNSATGAQLSEAEQGRLAEAAAAEALREKLKASEAELTAMTLSLEESRKKAEETLTLLAAAEAAKRDLTAEAGQSATEAERQAALLALAQDKLAGQEQASTEAQRRVALLNQQVSTLNQQLASIQQALNLSESDNQAAEVKLEDLGQQLNAALLQASQEQQRRLTLEEAERKRLEEEAADLARYRSEFFGRLSEILQGRAGVEVVGDRFVFQSEVLFGTGEATLSDAGRTSVARVTTMLDEIAKTIPPEIDWVIRVDGHTDSTPLSGVGRYRDNWELSQARALAVVRYMVDELGFPADRLAPTGFADTRPVAPDDSAENRARNRRIELKLTER
ncbi:peptidoglycan -binding protein [Paracoccus aurantiacus]|uniref:Peptidoglycan-binding protein n=1 Tax=Paracoccus aurantiacus TaxID=2599412 RepID=A0A5C6S7T3_9RHOB|nr:peptidoglycan -binding protein [Paracoccus aurantiacus]TXB70577.1 peptidoglycan -binding protein [Paracoccus aurantiacus]